MVISTVPTDAAHVNAGDEVLRLLADEPKQQLRRIPSEALLGEQEHLQRELVAARVDGEDSPVGFYRHRLAVINAEIGRRRRLEQDGAPSVPAKSRIPEATIRQIKELTDLVDLVAEDLEMAWYRTGKASFHCKLHGTDSDPSLKVYEFDDHWYCWGCNDGGDCFDWLIKARNMEWLDAVCYLAARRRIDLRPPVAVPEKPPMELVY